MLKMKFFVSFVFLSFFHSLYSQCSTTNISSLIPNPSFETNTGCPSTTSQLYLATSWNQASSATTDYFNCSFNSLIPFSNPPLPAPNGTGYIGFHDSNSGSIYKEYAGACLTGTMISGTSYTLQFFISSINSGNTNPNISIFGSSSCANLPFGGGGYLCPTAYAGWTQLSTTNTVAVSTTWTLVTMTFTPSSNINAIALGPGCATQTGTNYYYIDNLILNTTTSFTPPTANAGPNKVNNCTNTTNSLNGSVSGGTAGYSYVWSPSTGLNTTSSASPIANPSSTTNYTLTVTDANGCIDSDVVTVTVNKTAPVANAGSDKIYNCSTTPNLSGSGGGNYSWSPSTGLSNASIASPSASPTTTTNYTLTVTNPANGCSSTDQAQVTVNRSLPTANAGTDETTTCVIPNTTLSGTGGGNYSWSPSAGLNNATISGPIADPATTTTYTLTVTDPSNGCTDTDQVTITVDESAPTANAGPDLLIDCANTAGSMTGTGGVSYLWNTPNGIVTGSTINLSGTDTPGNYTLTATGANGCTGTDISILTVDQTDPSANAGPPLTYYCNTPTINLDGSSSTGAGITYNWSGPGIVSGGNTNTATINSGGTYTLIVTGSNSCTDLDSVIVAEDLNYPVANAGSDLILDCNNLTAILDGTSSSSGANITYTWTTPNGNIIGSTTTPSTTADLDGAYTITVANTSNGCSSTDDANITQDTITPVGNITNNAIVIDCNNPTGNFDASSSSGIGNIYQWTTNNGNIVSGANTATPFINLDGIYNLTITSANGCSNLIPIVESATIDTISPAISILIPDTLTCHILETVLDASGSQLGVTFNWNTTNGVIISGGTSSTPMVGSNGNYTLNIIAPNGCNTLQTTSVVNSQAPNAILLSNTTSGDQPLDVDFSESSTGIDLDYYLEYGNGDDTYQQNSSYTYTEIGEYEAILTVTDQYNCSDSDTIIITVNKLEYVIIPNGVSRNGDGFNDLFFIKHLHYFPENELQLFNRWGDLVFQAQPYINNWDGSSPTPGNVTGQEATSGTYFYMLKLYPDSEPMTGYVELKR